MVCRARDLGLEVKPALAQNLINNLAEVFTSLFTSRTGHPLTTDGPAQQVPADLSDRQQTLLHDRRISITCAIYSGEQLTNGQSIAPLDTAVVFGH